MSPTTEAQVLDALRPIQDPDFNRSIVDLGFVKDIEIDAGRVAFKIELTTPACPVKEKFQQAAEQAVGALAGVERVEVDESEGQVRTFLADLSPGGDEQEEASA